MAGKKNPLYLVLAAAVILAALIATTYYAKQVFDTFVDGGKKPFGGINPFEGFNDTTTASVVCPTLKQELESSQNKLKEQQADPALQDQLQATMEMVATLQNLISQNKC
jgi:hypothetical protein